MQRLEVAACRQSLGIAGHLEAIVEAVVNSVGDFVEKDAPAMARQRRQVVIWKSPRRDAKSGAFWQALGMNQPPLQIRRASLQKLHHARHGTLDLPHAGEKMPHRWWAAAGEAPAQCLRHFSHSLRREQPQGQPQRKILLGHPVFRTAAETRQHGARGYAV